MTHITFPSTDWESISPVEAGFDSKALKQAKIWLANRAGQDPYRAVIIRGGRIVAEWNDGVSRDEHLKMYSASKSIFSSMLGIVIAEGRISSADDKIIDYYPEAMDVPKGEGPKDGRFVTEKDYGITFRHLICNTSGYMKPGEKPGTVHHYQTFGMNILVHAMAKLYGCFDIREAASSPDLEPLIDAKIADPIGAKFSMFRENFNLHDRARIHIFGYANWVGATALDMARLGWLWCNQGRWEDKQIIPEQWMREAVKTAPDILANCTEEQWQYGHGFWTNDQGRYLPSLPHDSYAAVGAERKHIWVCPSMDLVVVQSPGPFQDHHDNDTGFVKLVYDACSDS